MNFLEEKILKDGVIREGNVLKVDSFLNHQMDVEIIDQIGKTFYDRFENKGVTRIVTIESSGIALGYATAKYFNLPFVFAKTVRQERARSMVQSIRMPKPPSITSNIR